MSALASAHWHELLRWRRMHERFDPGPEPDSTSVLADALRGAGALRPDGDRNAARRLRLAPACAEGSA